MLDALIDLTGTTKCCSKCGETKDVSAFSKDMHKKDGFRPSCKACDAAYAATRKEKKAAYDALYNATHQAERSAYRAAHRAEHAARCASWQKANPERRRAAWRRHYARKLGNGGTHTAEDVKKQGNIQRWKCWWCGNDCKDKYHVDHLVPLAKGGHNGPSNIVISCPHCNWQKNDKFPSEFCGRLL